MSHGLLNRMAVKSRAAEILGLPEHGAGYVWCQRAAGAYGSVISRSLARISRS
jgi:hypothetical protein